MGIYGWLTDIVRFVADSIHLKKWLTLSSTFVKYLGVLWNSLSVQFFYVSRIVPLSQHFLEGFTVCFILCIFKASKVSFCIILYVIRDIFEETNDKSIIDGDAWSGESLVGVPSFKIVKSNPSKASARSPTLLDWGEP